MMVVAGEVCRAAGTCGTGELAAAASLLYSSQAQHIILITSTQVITYTSLTG